MFLLHVNMLKHVYVLKYSHNKIKTPKKSHVYLFANTYISSLLPSFFSLFVFPVFDFGCDEQKNIKC
jgi:hypothetical protein